MDMTLVTIRKPDMPYICNKQQARYEQLINHKHDTYDATNEIFLKPLRMGYLFIAWCVWKYCSCKVVTIKLKAIGYQSY